MSSSSTSERDDRADEVAGAAEVAAARVARNTTRAEVVASLFGASTPVMVGRFELGRCIGRGSMGKVYEGFDPTLERKVGLKVIAGRPGISAERLLDEARALARLDHPHVVTIHEAGITEDGVVFCAMALLEGEDLRTRWRRSSPSREEVLSTTDALASALGALHERGVVHRDVKPENVVVVEGRPVLVDFGVARQTRAAGGDVERGYAVAGTPGYMAPEQRDGEPGDSRSDQFALAMMASEGLFGARPIIVDEEDGTQVEAPSGAAADPSWPVLARALATPPHERYPTVLTFADALARAGRPEVTERSPRRWVVLGLLVVSLVAYWGLRRGEPAPAAQRPLPTVSTGPAVPTGPTVAPETSVPSNARPKSGAPAADSPRRPLDLASPTRADPRRLIRRAVAFVKEAGPPGAEVVAANFLVVEEGWVDVTRAPGPQIRFEWIDPADPGRHGEATVTIRAGGMELSEDDGAMFYRSGRFEKYLPLALPTCLLRDALAAAEGLDGDPIKVGWGMRYARADEGHLTWHVYGRRGTQWHIDAATCALVEVIE